MGAYKNNKMIQVGIVLSHGTGPPGGFVNAYVWLERGRKNLQPKPSYRLFKTADNCWTVFAVILLLSLYYLFFFDIICLVSASVNYHS
jgi:hypothetical protein